MCGTFINQVVDEIPMVSRVVDAAYQAAWGAPQRSRALLTPSVQVQLVFVPILLPDELPDEEDGASLRTIACKLQEFSLNHPSQRLLKRSGTATMVLPLWGR